nr:unnamed protein product [Callosobruchus chinensis]
MLKYAFDLHAPVRTARVTKNAAPWLTPTLSRILKQRDTAANTFQQNPNDTNWENYKSMRNYAVASIRREKKAYLSHLSNLNSGSDWKKLQNLNICPRKQPDIPLQLLDPNEINNYFLSNFAQHDSHNRIMNSTASYYNNKFHENSLTPFIFRMLNPEEIVDIISSIKSSATGNDEINITMIRLCLPEILKPITHIVNVCLETGYFPIDWKDAIIIPLPKTEKPTDHSQLRPISILCTLSKVLEKAVYLQLTQYLDKTNTFPAYQSGFRKGHSTTTAILYLTDNIIRNLDNHINTILVMLDFSKAFDSVNHQILLSKLKYYGLSDTPLSFFKSYLTGRRQSVKTVKGVSDYRNVPCGVPQGSVLGPLLYLMYTFDLQECVEYCELQTYADDTQMSFCFDSHHIHEVSFKVNVDLANISDYCKRHCLKVNPTKSNTMLFCPKELYVHINERVSLTLDDVNIPFVEHVKNLGITLDVRLRFTEHLNRLSRMTYLRLRSLYANRHILNFKTRKKLVESLVMSVLFNSITIYYPCLDSVAKYRLQKIQNSCCRFVYGLRKYSHVTSKIKELQWLRLEYQYEYFLLAYVHRILKTNLPAYLHDKLTYRGDIISRSLRHNNRLEIPIHRTSLFQRSFTYNAVTLYNKVSQSSKNCEISSFKKVIKRQLLGS